MDENTIKKVIDENESEVRSYSRNFQVAFKKAKGSKIMTASGVTYLDFFSGAGALNYGHNNPKIKSKIIEYLENNGIMHGLDMYTEAKAEFIQSFSNFLKSKNLDYKIQFTGPTGTNAVEAALKLARKNTQRTNVIACFGAFHGMTLGSLSVTTDKQSRIGAGVPLQNTTFIPYPIGPFGEFDTYSYLKQILEDDHSGIEKPACFIIETVQAEGGVYPIPTKTLQKLYNLCKENDILFIVDDIQVGVSRTGSFFSFEDSGIVPDMVTLSKSISGIGLPMALLLLKPELDIWKPAEHNGTFRGNQLAFVAATAALELNTEEFNLNVKHLSKIAMNYLNEFANNYALEIRGKGLIIGIDFSYTGIKDISKLVMQECVKNKLIIERAGRSDSVLKILPPLTISEQDLINGLEIIKEAIEKVFKDIEKSKAEKEEYVVKLIT